MTTKTGNAFLGRDPLPLSAFFSDSMVVQDYPEKYTVTRGRPRAQHESYRQGMSEGFIYGTRTENGSNHWTRLVLFKPAEALSVKWQERVGYPFKSITFNPYGKDSGIYRVAASYMEGIGNTTLGFITDKDYQSIKQAAWSKSLGDAI